MALNVGYTHLPLEATNWKTEQEQTVSLLLFGLLHLIDAYAELNANETVIKIYNCIDDAA
ncbi:hypothetical protein [Nitrosovibrio tenuis]|nr:hypothetical protein [Nitrosovibrio tenuis]